MIEFLDYIADKLKLDSNYLENIIFNSDYYYKEYYIKKNDGGKRKICHPSPELKTLQYWVIRNLFDKFPVSDAAYAYRKGKSIKHHANIHVNNRNILHLDIKNFFTNITSFHIKKLLKENINILNDLSFNTNEMMNIIIRIVLKNNKLSIGAVSSPVISNNVMYNFDERVLEYCEKNNLLYTRYADDIYISSQVYIDKKIINFIETQLLELKLILNYKKTRFMSKKVRRSVTGLIITPNKKVTVGLEMRNKIKKMIYKKVTKNIGDPDVIMGYLSFIKDIEPKTYNNLITKYSKYCYNLDIIETLKIPEDNDLQNKDIVNI